MARADGFEQAGAPPVPYDGVSVFDQVPAKRDVTFVKPGRGSEGQRTSANRSRSGFNLRGVCEVLEEFGLDPVAEVSRILMERKPVTVIQEGQVVPVLDANGQPKTQPSLDIETRTKVLMELTNFVHPKLKAVEMTVKKPELSDEQVEARLVELLGRASKRALT